MQKGRASQDSPDGAAAQRVEVSTPVAALPQLIQIVLPTPWQVGPVQIYCVDSEPFTLIDTGVSSPASRSALEAALDSIGRGLEDVRRIVLTHYHGDHLGQAETIRRVSTEVEVCAHFDEIPMIEGFSVARDERVDETEVQFRAHGVDAGVLAAQRQWLEARIADDPGLCEATRVDRPLRANDVLSFKDTALRVIHAPGHTAGHIVLHEESHAALITGDTVMGNAVPSTSQYALDSAPDPEDRARRPQRFRGLHCYLETLRTLRALDVKTILPAHGGVIRRPARAIEDALLFYDVRVQRIERGLRTLAAMGQDVTAWEIWKALFPKNDPVTEMRNRMFMVIGALEELESRGQLETVRRDDGVLVHHHR